MNDVGEDLAELNVAVRLDSMQMPLRRSLEMASRMGASAVELDARNEIHPSQLSDTGLRQLRKILDDLNLKVAALRFPTRRGYEEPRDLDRRVEATKDAMQLAYRLGSTVVINSIGVVPGDEESAQWASMRSVLDDLGRYGTRIGAFLAAETGAEPGETLAKLIQGSDDSYIAVALNPGQLIINRHDVREAISALKDRIQIVCAVDGVIDLAAGRGIAVPLGQGTADFPELIGMLEDIQFRGRYVVGRAESSLEELAASIAYLKQL
ncbi:MAG: sugar phosphate isomerase/epimerase family protein [Rubripirellula sp.]